MITGNDIGQDFFVSVTDVGGRIGVINRCGDEKCLRHAGKDTGGRMITSQPQL
jgi:hypothetical protein